MSTIGAFSTNSLVPFGAVLTRPIGPAVTVRPQASVPASTTAPIDDSTEPTVDARRFLRARSSEALLPALSTTAAQGASTTEASGATTSPESPATDAPRQEFDPIQVLNEIASRIVELVERFEELLERIDRFVELQEVGGGPANVMRLIAGLELQEAAGSPQTGPSASAAVSSAPPSAADLTGRLDQVFEDLIRVASAAIVGVGGPSEAASAQDVGLQVDAII
jgi:hypothetical protein